MKNTEFALKISRSMDKAAIMTPGCVPIAEAWKNANAHDKQTIAGQIIAQIKHQEIRDRQT